MASILIRRDQFNITPEGIVHKPTDSHFAPHADDPYTGSIRLCQVGNVVPVGERYDVEEDNDPALDGVRRCKFEPVPLI
jgi:hypothetical protein